MQRKALRTFNYAGDFGVDTTLDRVKILDNGDFPEAGRITAIIIGVKTIAGAATQFDEITLGKADADNAYILPKRINEVWDVDADTATIATVVFTTDQYYSVENGESMWMGFKCDANTCVIDYVDVVIEY